MILKVQGKGKKGTLCTLAVCCKCSCLSWAFLFNITLSHFDLTSFDLHLSRAVTNVENTTKKTSVLGRVFVRGVVCGPFDRSVCSLLDKGQLIDCSTPVRSERGNNK